MKSKDFIQLRNVATLPLNDNNISPDQMRLLHVRLLYAIDSVEKLAIDNRLMDESQTEGTIAGVMRSLESRGFYTGPDDGKLSEQLDAVLEELAEVADLEPLNPRVAEVLKRLGNVARMLRRESQGRPYDRTKMGHEVCDVIIAAICLGARVWGEELPAAIDAKCRSDEQRGYLHMGPAPVATQL